MGVLELAILIVLVLWLAGVGFVAGNAIHLLLVIVLVLVVIRLLQGRRIL